MRVLIDTNVILDVLTGREPHCEYSAAFLKLCGMRITGLMTASQTTDIFYLLRREGKDTESAKAIIRKLADNVKIVDVTAFDVENALVSDMPDYEDALLAFCGKRRKADYIVTRNEKDFRQSPVPALSPQAFLARD
ncbi:MAG: PIN domain-containing protein [Clostridiales Family XIII bacterium]|jgi:predicted nucleic acid-binding protein|nr:PIN domain-containing protein [Clostridiales Family XIII bacterium]